MSRLWWAVPLVVVAVAVVIAPRPALAGCAVPSPSPYRFTGTVIQTSNDGRLALVRTDDGRIVVIGTSETQILSYQRRYQVGVRYEFDPTNDTSPYLDSTCTETHEIGGRAAPSETVPGNRTVPAPVVARRHGAAALVWWAVIEVALLIVVGVGVWWAWTRRPWPLRENRRL